MFGGKLSILAYDLIRQDMLSRQGGRVLLCVKITNVQLGANQYPSCRNRSHPSDQFWEFWNLSGSSISLKIVRKSSLIVVVKLCSKTKCTTYFWTRCIVWPNDCPSVGEPGPHLIHGSTVHWAPHFTRHLDRFSRFSTIPQPTLVTNRLTHTVTQTTL